MNERCPQAVILIANAFDEQTVVQCLTQLRGRGIDTELVSNRGRHVTGSNGLVVQVDRSLGELSAESSTIDTVAIPGPRNCTVTLLTDPRVHELVQKVLERQGCIYSLSPVVQPLLVRTGTLKPEQITSFLTLDTSSPSY